MLNWSLSNFKDLASIFQSIVTPIGIIAAGAWAYRKYIIEASKYPHIETSAEIEFIGHHNDFWIVELKAVLTNKGKSQHRIERFEFELNSIRKNDPLLNNSNWSNQLNFPNLESKESFLPKNYNYFIIGPSVTAKYSHITKINRETSFLILHCWFEYCDDRGFSHSMERTVAVPEWPLQTEKSPDASSSS